MLDWLPALFTAENLIALATLTGLEIVLGIDNIVFLSIVTGRLPEAQRPKARRIGLGLAMGARIGLLLAITWVMGLTAELFRIFGHGVSGKDLILVLGGLFLIGKATHEIHSKLEHPGDEQAGPEPGGKASFGWTILMIIVIDLVFSLDSVITAVGMVNPAAAGGHDGADGHGVAMSGDRNAKLAVMILAVMIAVGVMMVFAGAIGSFIERHPTVKVLALAFLILIGVMLVAEGFGEHVDKGYIYFAMAFSLGIELLNMRMRKRQKPMVGGITGISLPDRDPM